MALRRTNAGLALANKPQFRAAVAQDGALELMIYGDIVDAGTIEMLEAWGYPTDSMVCALGVKKAIDAAGAVSTVRSRINSPGGDAFEGMAIHSILTGWAQALPGRTVESFIDGVAASSASIVAMAGSKRVMGRTAMMMAHNAWTDCRGNKNDFLKMAGTLDTVDESIAAAYMDRTGMSLDDVKALMDAETWMSAQDCVDQGFATGVVELPAEQAALAMAQARGFKALAKLRNLPAALWESAISPLQAAADQACDCDCEACRDGDCANCSNEDCADPNCKDCPMQSSDDSSAQSNLSLFAARAKALTMRKRF